MALLFFFVTQSSSLPQDANAMSSSISLRLVREHYLLAALLLFAFLNGLLWSLVVPFDGAPDEVHKYEIVYFMWKNRRVPVFGPAADVYIRPAPGTRDGCVYGISATSPCGAYFMSSLFMYMSPSDTPVVLLHMARLSSVVCVVATLYFAYKLVHALFGSAGYALGVTALIALIPQFTYTGAYVNDDAYQVMAVTWSIWGVVRGVQRGWTLRNRLLVGLALVLVSVGKQNGWVAVSSFVLLALSSACCGNWRERFQTWVTMFLPACLTLGSWFARNWLLYHDFLALSTARIAWQDFLASAGFEQQVPLTQQGYGFLDLLIRTRWPRTMFESFWGRFYYLNVPMDVRIYSALLVCCLLGAAATVWALLRKREKVFPARTSARILGCTGLAFALLFAAAAATSLYNDYQAQGRYFFPLIVPIVMFLTLGIHTFGRLYLKRYLASLWTVALVLLLALNVFCLVYYIHGHPYPDIPLPIF